MLGSKKGSDRRSSVVRQLTEEESSAAGCCPLCDRPDVADKWMVQCELCEKWFHFSCAKVNSSVKDRSFACTTCALPPGPESVRTGASSTSSTRRRLELLRLEEDREIQERILREHAEEEAALQKKAQEEEKERRKRIMEEKLEIARRYLGKKYEVLQEEERSNDGKSRRSNVSTRSNLDNVLKWVEDHDLAMATGSGTNQVPISSTLITEAGHKEASVEISADSILPTAAVQSGARTTPVTVTRPNDCNDIASWGMLVPRSDQNPVNPPACLPPPRSTTSHTPAFLGAAEISPPPPLQAGLPATFSMNISAPHVGEKSRADLERELHEVQQQLANLKRSSSGHHHPSPNNNIAPVVAVTTSLSNTMSTGMSNLHDSSQVRQGVARQAHIPIDYSVGTQAAGLAQGVAIRTSQNTVLNSNASQAGMTRVPNHSNDYSYQGAPYVQPSRQYEPIILNSVNQNPMCSVGSVGGHLSRQFVSSFSNPLILHSSGAASIPFVASVPSVPNPIITPSVSRRIPNDPPPLVCGPNSQQIAARHVVPKELPEFTGDPIDWPLFVSSYTNSTRMCGYTDDENLMRLQRCLKGNAKEAVRGHLYHPSSVPQVMATLETLFGRPELIVKCLMNKVHATPAPKAEKLESLISFGLVVQNLCSQLRSMGMDAHLSNPTLLQELVEKLPANIKLDWALYQRQVPVVDLNAFGTYMTTIVSAASNVTFYTEPLRKQEKPKGKDKGFINAHSSEPDQKINREVQKGDSSAISTYQPKPCLMCKKDGHKLRDCNSFKNLSLENRWKTTQQLNLCRRCLIPHGKWPCKATVCGEGNCNERHHQLLHPGKPHAPSSEVPTSSKGHSTSLPPANVNVHRQLPCPVLFRILPVTLHGKTASINTLAFLDDGSSYTLMEKGLADELGVEGEVEPLCLQWTSNIQRTEWDSLNVQLEISAAGKDRKHSLECVRTVESLNLPPQSLDYEGMASKFDYLQGLPVDSYSAAAPRILIGADNAKLLLTLKKREGRYCEPVAAKTRLGWTIYGKVEGLDGSPDHRLLHICARSCDQQLHDAVNDFFSIENVGVALVPLLEGEEDRRSREILEATTMRTSSGRFQTGLLWKFDYIEFPENRYMAEKRLMCLERSLSKKPELYANVRKQMLDYQTKGYAHRLTEQEISNSDPRRVWYLPLGVVQNPNKPGKVRVVWDAAAKTGGVSLNSMLLKGPDLLTSLPSVLFRFRQREIAITGDIKEMFHQILIRPEDRQAQRFLWRDNPEDPVREYVMDVATFGSTCSPCSAQYVKNKNAEEWKQVYPEAATAIVESTYVDDYANSSDTVEEAVRVALEVKKIHASAGFEIRNWLSSSKRVL
ncbi:uncharacterized protein LOC134285592 [Aedes albopictus]|uniref:PHD-type domain-containing protein n=1 Tax=Aedes albopictus TaxID=7160 RepID=A0ABM1Y5Q8_AEDAL